jgi:hypothetical protein
MARTERYHSPSSCIYIHTESLRKEAWRCQGKEQLLPVEVEDLARHCACGWPERVEVDFCARRAEDIKKPAASSLLKAVLQKGISVI